MFVRDNSWWVVCCTNQKMKNLQIFVICFDLDSLESNHEPRFLTVRTESITDTRAVDLFRLLWCASQMRNSVSSSFNLRLSFKIHEQKAIFHAFWGGKLVWLKIRTKRNVNLCIFYTTMNITQMSLTISKSLLVYSLNRMGPRQERWGTSHSKMRLSQRVYLWSTLAEITSKNVT